MTSLRVWATGLHRDDTGAGVFQRHVYSRVGQSKGVELRLGIGRPPGVGVGSIAARAYSTASFFGHLLLPIPRDVDVALIAATPAPLRVPVPFVLVVYDLRWLRVRSTVGNRYRLADLRRATRHATRIMTISDQTLRALASAVPHALPKARVVRLGPGNASLADFADGEAGSVLLVGSSPHKRNELLAEALARSRPPWVQRVLGLNLSTEARGVLARSYGVNCECYGRLGPDEVRALFRRASVFVSG